MKKIITALASATCLLCAATAQAGVYKIDFTATNFQPSSANNSVVVPQNPVSGSIGFSADSLGSAVISIDWIDLTIANHVYTPDEIRGVAFADHSYLFGANESGINTIVSGTNDFYLYGGARSNGFMSYTVAGSQGFWDSYSFSATFTEQTAAVPEPGSLALLLAGAGGLGAMLRRRRV